jgi:hypothetical protein
MASWDKKSIPSSEVPILVQEKSIVAAIVK